MCRVFCQPYRAPELTFAYCYRVYLRWRTHCARPYDALARLDRERLRELASRFKIHVLECETNPTDLLVLASLLPHETVSACASKLKGQTSKWLRGELGLNDPPELLSRGYFACTSGQSTREAVDVYLRGQCEHHGYADRPAPPVYVEAFEISAERESQLNARHASTVLDFHLVLATWRRRGVFGTASAGAVISRWREFERQQRFGLLKVSSVPDHVHVAVRLHPTVSPAALALTLMNTAQEVIFNQYSDAAIQAKVERLWQPTAYIGSFGDLATAEVARYIERWRGASE